MGPITSPYKAGKTIIVCTYVNKYLLSVGYVYLTITFSAAGKFIKKLR